MKVKQGSLMTQAWMNAEETVKVMAALHLDGGAARFVGGCVRDALVNREVIDIDIATTLTPDDVIARLASKKIKHISTGLAHGTVTAVVNNKPFEITTLRRDVEGHGRHADVAFVDDWQIDAARRDFTINALYATQAGEVFDFYGGIDDLRDGRVRFVGDAAARIEEDVLRILRFFRFYAHFGQGAPDREALVACTAAADQIPNLSAERIRQEVLKLLSADRCAATWQWMLEAGVIAQFLPEAHQVGRLETLLHLAKEWHGGAPTMLRLASLLDVTKGGLPLVVDSLRLSNAEARYLDRLLLAPTALTPQMTAADIQRITYRQGSDITRAQILLEAASRDQPEGFQAHYQTATAFRPARFPLTGTDILKIGIPAGPAVGEALAALEEWWMTKDFKPGRTACLEKMTKDFAPKRR